VSVFTEGELAYMTAKRQLGPRAAGRDVDNPEYDSIDVGGHDLARTKKYRDLERSGRAALAVDDLASTDPWRPRRIKVRGRAEAIKEPRPLIRIRPERIVSWGIESDAIGARHSRAVGGNGGDKGG
jgi:pyridoxamine 5'-phosphate oxidase family protein